REGSWEASSSLFRVESMEEAGATARRPGSTRGSAAYPHHERDGETGCEASDVRPPGDAPAARVGDSKAERPGQEREEKPVEKEHGGEEGQEAGSRVDMMTIVAEKTGRFEAVVEKPVLEAGSEGQLPEEDEDVDRDDRPSEEGNALARDRIAQGDHGSRSSRR